MGGLISRPVAFVHQLMAPTRLAASRLVKTARNRVVTGISKSKRSVTTAINSTCTAVVDRANNTKNDVVTHVNSCMSVVTTRTGVLHQWYRDTKPTRDVLVRRFCYTILLLALLAGAVVAALMLWDIYHGDYAAASRKADAVEAFASRCSDTMFRMLAVGIRLTMRLAWLLFCYTWLCFELAFRCTASALRAFLCHLWSAAVVVVTQGAEAGKVGIAYAANTSLSASHVMYHGSKAITQFSIAGSKSLFQTTCYTLAVCSEYGAHAAVIAFNWLTHATSVSFDCSIHCTQIALEYLSWFFSVMFQFSSRSSVVIFDYVQHGTKVSASHISYGSRSIGNYTWRGTAYLYEHGTVAVAELLVSAYVALIHAGTVMASHFSQAAIYLWGALESGLQMILTGSYSGGVLLADGSKVLLDRTSRASVILAEWAAVAFDYVSRFSVATAGYVSIGSCKAFDAVCTISGWTGELLWHVSLVVYHALFVVLSNIYHVGSVVVSLIGHFLSSVVYGRTGGVIHFVAGWVTTSASFIANWCWVGVSAVSYYLHVVLNKHGVRYLFVGCHVIFAFLCQLYAGALCLIEGAVRQLWAGFSLLIHLVYSFPIWLGSLLRMIVSALVAAVTFVFRCVIWMLTEIVLLLASMLHQYDIYREILFFAFIIVMTVYCSGLVRDRHQSGGDDGSDNDDIDGDIEDVTDSQADTESIQNAENERRTEQSPPAYQEHTELPCYDSANDTKQEASDDSDLGSDFELDQEVPDVMDSSGSEAELEFMRSS